MTSDNFSNESRCDVEWYRRIGFEAEIPVYYVAIPVCIVLAILGHSVCLVAFYKQSKKEPAYFYQVVLTGTETAEAIFALGYCLTVIFSWNPRGSSVWFRSKYVLMLYAVYLAVPFLQMSYTTCQLLTICMTSDRVLAIWKPTFYKSLQHDSIRKTAFVCCTVLGITTSVFECFRSGNLEMNAETGIYAYHQTLIKPEAKKFLSRFRDGLRLGGLLALVSLSVALTSIYRKRARKVEQLTGRTHAEAKREKKTTTTNAEMTLTLLTVCQCAFGTVSTVSTVVYFFASSFSETFVQCDSQLWAPILDVIICSIEVANFYAILIVSKQFRKLITDNLPFFQKRRQVACM